MLLFLQLYVICIGLWRKYTNCKIKHNNYFLFYWLPKNSQSDSHQPSNNCRALNLRGRPAGFQPSQQRCLTRSYISNLISCVEAWSSVSLSWVRATEPMSDFRDHCRGLKKTQITLSINCQDRFLSAYSVSYTAHM